jgi:hypothetical protein
LPSGVSVCLGCAVCLSPVGGTCADPGSRGVCPVKRRRNLNR